MKKIISVIIVFAFSFSLLVTKPYAADLNQDDLKLVTISLLHPTVVKALKEHYGGITQFEELKLAKIVSRQLPADLKDDSAFKSPASVFDITVELEAFVGEGKKEHVTIVLSNEFSGGGFDVMTLKTE
jgi:hypothetical protein